MIVGFGFENVDEPTGDKAVLESIGCDRIVVSTVYSAVDGYNELEKIKELLRDGDTLAVVNLSRMGHNLQTIVAIVAKLHASGVKVRAEENGVIPGTAAGDAFGEACAILAGFAERLVDSSSVESRKQIARRRGRPVVMTEELRNRAERLLIQNNLTVPEVARILRVSPATVYRWSKFARAPK